MMKKKDIDPLDLSPSLPMLGGIKQEKNQCACQTAAVGAKSLHDMNGPKRQSLKYFR